MESTELNKENKMQLDLACDSIYNHWSPPQTKSYFQLTRGAIEVWDDRTNIINKQVTERVQMPKMEPHKNNK